MAIGIRQLTYSEKDLPAMLSASSIPDVDVPVFYGQSGVSLMNTMLPTLEAVSLSISSQKRKH